MSSPFAPGQNPGAAPGAAAARRGPVALPTPPKGWPIGSYPTYAEAQKAVDFLSDQQFPVQHVTIVGVDLMSTDITRPWHETGGAIIEHGKVGDDSRFDRKELQDPFAERMDGLDPEPARRFQRA